MTDNETKLAVIVAALLRRSARSLLQRRVTPHVLDQIEALVAAGWSIAELAEHLAAAGVTRRDGRRLSAGHFGVLVTRARAKARAASRQESQRPTHHQRPAAHDVAKDGTAPAITQINENLGKLAEKAERRTQGQKRQADTEQLIAARLDTMFGRDHGDLGSPLSTKDAKASSSSKADHPRNRRQSP